MGKKGLNKIVILGLLICISAGTILGVRYYKEYKKQEKISVTREEIIHYLSFVYDSKEECRNKFETHLGKQISWSDVGFILDTLGITDYIDIKSMDLTSNKKINKEEWSKIYFEMVDILDIKKEITRIKIIILNQENKEDQYKVITDQGAYNFWNKDYFEQYGVYEVAIKGDEILGGLFEVNEEAILSNVWLAQKNAEVSVMLEDKEIRLENVSLMSDDTKGICDIYFQDMKIKKIIQKQDVIKGKLLSFDEKQIEVEGYGAIQCEEFFRLYQTYDNVIEKDKNDMVVGDDWIEFVVANEKICAGLITQPLKMEMIRVLLLNNEGDVGHEIIEITSTDPFYVIEGEQNIKYEANEIFQIKKESNLLESGYLRVESGTAEGRIIVQSIERSSGTPSYDGKLEIRKNENELILVNEIAMENYLYGVLPSEMPSSFGVEALKVQAVCARSFAYCQILKNDYSSYGAHVDDSTNYQVYNNLETNAESMQAVNDTNGMVATYQGEVIETYYFSCSSGHTTDFTAWGGEEDVSQKYLKGVFVGESIESKLELDLSREDNFKNFIEYIDGNWYDQSGKWFRWKCRILNEDITNTINDKILQRYKVNPTLIHVSDDKGEVTIEEIKKSSKILSIEVAKRGENGNILELKIQEDNADIIIKSEYNIRIILGSVIKMATNNDNEKMDINGLLPSAFFYIAPTYDKNKKITGWQFTGGGHGHGIGLSQTACKSMDENGMDFIEILNYFYHDIELKDMYKEE